MLRLPRIKPRYALPRRAINGAGRALAFLYALAPEAAAKRYAALVKVKVS
jgi:hypothetical protein